MNKAEGSESEDLRGKNERVGVGISNKMPRIET